MAAIQQVREEILDRLNELEINQLRGELEGFQQRYASYDPDPGDPVEEERLRSLIDDSAQVLGRLGAHLDTVGANPTLALETWAIYIPLLYLRAQAMAERQATYRVDEARDALLSFDMALPRLAGLLAHLRRLSDSDFGPVVCRPIFDSQDSQVCWYWSGNEQLICGSLRDPRGVEKCQQSRSRDMDSAYLGFPGVRELTATSNQLQDARDALDVTRALDLLTHHGVEVGEVVIVRGRLARVRREVGGTPGAGDAETSADWFS